MAECAHVQTGDRAGGAAAKEIAGGLGQPDGGVAGRVFQLGAGSFQCRVVSQAPGFAGI